VRFFHFFYTHKIVISQEGRPLGSEIDDYGRIKYFKRAKNAEKGKSDT